MFLLWLRMQCLVPFDICSIDSTNTYSITVAEAIVAVTDESLRGAASSSKLVANIVSFCRSCLADTGPTRECAALCLSTLLTRPDMEVGILNRFCLDSIETFQAWLRRGKDVSTELSEKSFEMVGVLQCCCQVLFPLE